MGLTRLLFALACASWNVVLAVDENFVRIPMRTHSLDAPFLDSEMQSRWWDFGGDTIIRADSYVRLTADLSSRKGYIWSRVPLTATNWEIEVDFDIHGKGHLYGDGFAIWLTKDRAQQGSVFGAPDKFEGLGVFIDTYKNNRPGVVFPYIMGMIGDGKTEYDSANDGKANELGGCSARGVRNPGVESRIRLTYFKDQNLTVTLQYQGTDEWTPCFEIANATIPAVAYLGFSAETGELSDNHDIISVHAKNIYDEKSKEGKRPVTDARNNRKAAAAKAAVARERGSWSWFFLKIVLFVLLLGGAYIGFTFYRSQRRGSRF